MQAAENCTEQYHSYGSFCAMSAVLKVVQNARMAWERNSLVVTLTTGSLERT